MRRNSRSSAFDRLGPTLSIVEGSQLAACGSRFALALVFAALLAPMVLSAQEQPRDPTSITRLPAAAVQPPPRAAQEGFVPVDPSQQREEIPAAPLVMAAYAVAWLAVFVYAWSIWQRLGKVEREIADLTRRAAGGGRQ
jgi:CcmD family protein